MEIQFYDGRNNPYIDNKYSYPPSVRNRLYRLFSKLSIDEVKKCLNMAEPNYEDVKRELRENEYIIGDLVVSLKPSPRIYLPVSILAKYMLCPRLGLLTYGSRIDVWRIDKFLLLVRGRRYHECIEEVMKDKLLGVSEVAVLTFVGSALLYGVIDYLGFLGDLVLVLEFKSGTSNPLTFELYMYQTLLYSMIFSLFTNKTVIPITVYRDKAVYYPPPNYRAIRKTIKDMLRMKNTPRRSPFCSRCQYSRSCPLLYSS